MRCGIIILSVALFLSSRSTHASIVIPKPFLLEFRQRAPMVRLVSAYPSLTYPQQFEGHNQHDSHEFIRYLLDLVASEKQSVADSTMRKTPNTRSHPAKRDVQVISDIFAGEIESEMLCDECCAQRIKVESFTDLSVTQRREETPVNSPGPHPVAESGKNPIPHKISADLNECLAGFTRRELLHGYTCPFWYVYICESFL